MEDVAVAAAPAAAPAPDGAPAPASARFRLLEAALRREPTSFGFFQAVRLIEAMRRDRTGVGRHTDPAGEVVRFGVNPAISFPPSEIHSLALPDEGPARIAVNFMGVTGPQSVLPWHYSLLAMERVRARDTAMVAFLDLFHHRLLSLFYRAWARHRPGLAYREEEDTLRTHLLDLVGLGGEGAGEPGMEEMLAFHVGLVAPPARSALALEQLVGDLFGVPRRSSSSSAGGTPSPPTTSAPSARRTATPPASASAPSSATRSGTSRCASASASAR
jgi:type VI secretion system protein ImpH